MITSSVKMARNQPKFRPKFVIALTLAVCCLKVANGQSSSSFTICEGKLTCRECIQTGTCGWCLEPNFQKPRCHVPDGNYCPVQLTFDPRNEFRETVAKKLSKASRNGTKSAEEIVQIYPQEAQLKLRLGEVYKMDVKYSQAEDYPVDLYYLMDLSQSMKDDKETLSQLGVELSREMRKITSNFRLGFGSFVEKELMPFVSTVPRLLKNPCADSNDDTAVCESPYGYQNHVALSTDTNTFQENVKNANVSSNIDGPEGGLDALLQAVVCRDEVGWRTQARRLLLFSTDDGFHYAGDGKLAGLIVPNDGECHLNARNQYTHSTLQDYPSISQVNRKVQDNQIHVIFAVTENQLPTYEGLARLIDGASAAMLSKDSSNIVSLVYEQYNKISSSIELKDNHIEGLLDIKYFSTCKDNVRKQRNRCDELKQNELVQFDVEITLLRCPANPQEWTQVLKISPVGIDESLTVNVELLCGCSCERTGQKNAAECSGVGTLQCGLCNCGASFKGEKCECSVKDVNSMDPNACRPTNTSSVCNERGLCKCGVCECYKRETPEEQVTGKYCECDNFSCERIDGLFCSGLKQGRCVCGQCECNPGWTGPSCDCSTSEDACKPEGVDEVCSGHGICECGACKCKKTQDGRFSGRHCEKCVTCPGLRCNEYESCVLCRQFKMGPWSEAECLTKCSSLSLQSVRSLEVNEESGDKRCTFSHNQCRYEFMYNEYVHSDQLNVLEKPDCPADPFTLGLVLIVIGAVVLLGLAALLVWKLVTSICDRREYARFEQERANAKFDESDNPLYKEPTSTFQNPTFADKMAGEGANASQLRG